jgi:hypothetical protein
LLVGLVEARTSNSSNTHETQATAQTGTANEHANSHPVHRGHDVAELVNDGGFWKRGYELCPFFTIDDTAFAEDPNHNPIVVTQGEAKQD